MDILIQLLSNVVWRSRVLLFYFATAAISFIFYPLMLFVSFIMNYDSVYFIGRLYAMFVIYLARFICGLKFQVFGRKKLPKEPAVILANHQSFWDNLIMIVLFPKQCWVIKEELLDIPLFGWGLKLMQPIAVNRSSEQSIRYILERGMHELSQGKWIVIFPESTRVHPDQDRKFKPSGVKLAKMANVPIVPIAHNAGTFWPPKSFWFTKSGTIKIVIGGVITQEDHNEVEVRTLNERVEGWIIRKKNLLRRKYS